MPILVQVIAVVLAHAIGAWLLTYLLHSTLLIVLARGIERTHAHPSLTAVAWRTAIFGPLFTASLHTAVPFGSPFRMSAEPAGAVLGSRPVLSLVVVACWCTIVAVRVIGSVRAGLHGRATLGTRRPCTDPQLRHRFALRTRASGLRRMPKLTTSHASFSPAALAPAEVCLPAAVFNTLPPAQQDALLAHELAHVARHDPAWCGAARVLADTCVFQPLNRYALRRLHHATEHAADARAIGETGDALSLALALEALAPYTLNGAAAGTRATGSPLVERVRRILDQAAQGGDRTRRGGGHGTTFVCVMLLLGACLAAGPGVNFTSANAAASIPALRPSSAPPTAEMLAMREVNRHLRELARSR